MALAGAPLKDCRIDPVKTLGRQIQTPAGAEPLKNWAGKHASPLAEILSAGRIETWYRPVFASTSLELWGYECLALARTEAGELISPADLFSGAKKDNLVFMLDRVCRERHIENVSLAGGRDYLSFLINFLPTVIYDPKVCSRTTFEAARKSGVHAAVDPLPVFKPGSKAA